MKTLFTAFTAVVMLLAVMTTPVLAQAPRIPLGTPVDAVMATVPPTVKSVELSASGTKAMLHVLKEFSLPHGPQLAATTGAFLIPLSERVGFVLFYDGNRQVTGSLTGPLADMEKRIEDADGQAA